MVIIVIFFIQMPSHILKSHRWCYGYRARLECGSSWARDPDLVQPKPIKWYVLLLR